MASISRRTVLVSIGVSALLLGNACAVFRRQSDLEAALEELDTLLTQVDSEVDEDIMVIARNIKEQATQLLETHETFAEDFNRLAADRQVTRDTLVELASAYDTRRLAQRSKLLRNQDELHAAVPDEAWEEILTVLNKKGRAVVPPHAREA